MGHRLLPSSPAMLLCSLKRTHMQSSLTEVKACQLSGTLTPSFEMAVLQWASHTPHGCHLQGITFMRCTPPGVAADQPYDSVPSSNECRNADI
mmetsp:Transcript_10481/g.17594  ORF Transcript_10481/g.17594 Transcript_10481/m.17594 type:complete len:93 (-) Transcript_10481:254-532(-)